MGFRGNLVGKEVPILGSDSITWIDLTVSSSISTEAEPGSFAPRTEDDCGWCFHRVQAGSSSLVICRIHKQLPHVMEVLEFYEKQEFPQTGLRIFSPDALSPFAFVGCQFVTQNKMLWALTVSGVAYRMQLNNVDAYCSPSIIIPDDELDLRSYINQDVITCVAVYLQYLVVGTSSGSVIRLKILPTSQGSQFKFRDGNGAGRLCEVRSIVNNVGAVQFLVIARLQMGLYIIVLHSDGTLNSYHFFTLSRVLSHKLHAPSKTGTVFKKLWAGSPFGMVKKIPLAILHQQNSEDPGEAISVYAIHSDSGSMFISTIDPYIPLTGKCVDVQFSEFTDTCNILILQSNGLVSRQIIPTVEEFQFYVVEEEFIADHLFQSSDRIPENLLWIAQSMFSSVKEHSQFVSSIFLRKLLHPGTFSSGVFQSALLEYDRHLPDSELRSLTVDGLKRKILSLIEQVDQTPLSEFCRWKNFCKCYFDQWCRNNVTLCVFSKTTYIDPIVLIRKNSASLFRSIEKIEQLVAGPDEVIDAKKTIGLSSFDDELCREILCEVIDYVNRLSKQMGKTTSSVLYESFIRMPTTIYSDVLPCLLNILQIGDSSSMADLNTFYPQSDIVTEFPANMLLSLHSLSSKLGGWCRVLEAIQCYIGLLIPDNTVREFYYESSFDVRSVLLVHSSSQIATTMFESAANVLLFLSYLLQIAGQVDMSCDEVSRVQLDLIPMLEEIILGWFIIHFFASLPFESPTLEDFSYQLPPQKIDSSIDKRWSTLKDRQGKCNFTRAFLLLSDDHKYCFTTHKNSHSSVPRPQYILSDARDFISWILRGGAEEKSYVSISRIAELGMILIRNGQYDTAKLLIGTLKSCTRKKSSSRSLQDAPSKLRRLRYRVGTRRLARVPEDARPLTKGQLMRPCCLKDKTD